MIPAISATSSLVATGLNPDGTMEVPSVKRPEQASYYELGPAPGEIGPAMILGHINGGGRPGVFAQLPELGTGDEILIMDAIKGPVKFVVYKIEIPKKTAFPWDEVTAETIGPELRLISCTGNFVGGDLGYDSNAVVFAKLAA